MSGLINPGDLVVYPAGRPSSRPPGESPHSSLPEKTAPLRRKDPEPRLLRHTSMRSLFRFFGGYPRAKFSELAVVHALNSNHRKSYIKRALRQLVDKGVIRRSINNNIPLYSMTEDKSLCSLASNLAKLDWNRWQLMLRQTLPISVKQGC